MIFLQSLLNDHSFQVIEIRNKWYLCPVLSYGSQSCGQNLDAWQSAYNDNRSCQLSQLSIYPLPLHIHTDLCPVGHPVQQYSSAGAEVQAWGFQQSQPAFPAPKASTLPSKLLPRSAISSLCMQPATIAPQHKVSHYPVLHLFPTAEASLTWIYVKQLLATPGFLLEAICSFPQIACATFRRASEAVPLFSKQYSVKHLKILEII